MEKKNSELMLIYLLNTRTTDHLNKSSGSVFKKQWEGSTLWHNTSDVSMSFAQGTVNKK